MRYAFILFHIGHYCSNAITDIEQRSIKFDETQCEIGFSKNDPSTNLYTQRVSGPNPRPRHGVDFIGPLWLPRNYKVTCCRGGQPAPENPDMVANWTQRASDYAVDERAPDGAEDQCRAFEGTFLLSATALFNFTFSGYGVRCMCPEAVDALDRHCRKLAPCLNNGYRSQSLGMLCSCPEPYFGELCAKICDQGQILKGVDGRSYCSCLPFYQGEQCTDMVCLNGGVEVHGRCTCPPTYVGYHCEIDANRTAQHGARFQRFGDNNELFSRDISGTVFSLVMIIVLVVSMYLLMKHRMQVQSRFTASRRDEIARAAAVYGITRRGDIIAPEDLRIAPFVAAGIDGPPPYVLHTFTTRMRGDILPPLPSYEDATKDPPLRLSSPVVESSLPLRVLTAVSGGGPSSSALDATSHSDPVNSSQQPQVDELSHNHSLETPAITRVITARRSL